MNCTIDIMLIHPMSAGFAGSRFLSKFQQLPYLSGVKRPEVNLHHSHIFHAHHLATYDCVFTLIFEKDKIIGLRDMEDMTEVYFDRFPSDNHTTAGVN